MLINFLRLLLLPFSGLYALVVWLRHKLYNRGVLKSITFDLPIICVGNLAVGGAGKTPTTEYLVRLLADYKIAILSRGYGRKTKGFVLADAQSTAASIGDEPLQYHRKFKQVTVAVCENRVLGIEKLKNQHDVIILDDAFQHRAVSAGFNILLFEFDKLRRFQFLLPAGNLRDIFSSRKRADVCIVSKSPNPLPSAERLISEQKLRFKPKRVLHSFLRYADLIHFNGEIIKPLIEIKHLEVVLVTGIANPAPLLSELEKYTKNIQHRAFADHYAFTNADIKAIIRSFEQPSEKEKIIITTEKDSQRLKEKEFEDLLLNLPIFYLPIQVDFFEEDKIIFDKLILEYVKSNRGNR